MDPWKFLDELGIRVYCISLIERGDRYESSRQEFERVGLLSRVKYYRPERHKDGGRIGCWLSHRNVIIEASETGKPMLIFEDDIYFSKDWYTQLYIIEKFLREKSTWDMFYLGAFDHKIKETREGIVSGVFVCTHAYFIHPRCIRELVYDVDFYPPSESLVHLDIYYLLKRFSTFCLERKICYQNMMLGTDNTRWATLFQAFAHLLGRLNPLAWGIEIYYWYNIFDLKRMFSVQ